uniref:G-protein coupled receptors family 1 profile domain-containing protein n=1 Tax=Panagrolaimus sp. JU765 TaxID=591449 RepID=A0AC34PWB3_9BILA
MATIFSAWAVLVEILTGLGFNIFSIVTFIQLLLVHQKGNYSPTLVFYVLSEILTCTFVGIYLIFLGVFWRYTDSVYNAKAMYYFGVTASVTVSMRPFAVFALGIDRILITTMLTHYKSYFTYFPIVLSLGGSLTLVFVFFAIGYYYVPLVEYGSCFDFTCLYSGPRLPLYSYSREACSTVNLITGLILFLIVRKKVAKGHWRQKYDRHVLYTFVCTVFFDFLPHVLSAVMLGIFNLMLSQFLGPQSAYITCVEIFTCALCYRHSFKADIQTTKTVVLTTQTK